MIAKTADVHRHLGRAAFVGALVFAAACGGGDVDDEADDSTSAATEPVATSATDTTVGDTMVREATIDDTTASESTDTPATSGGADSTESTTESTEPAADAPRVVALAEEVILADLLALGIDPVASSATVDEVGFQGLEGIDTGGIEVLPMTTLSLEYLASLEPDVIVTFQFWVDQVGAEVLSEIAELVVVPDGLSTEERLRYLAETFDRTEEAEEALADLAEARAAAAGAVADDCAVSLAAIYAGPNVAAFVEGPWEIPLSVLETGCVLVPDASEAAPDQNGRAFLSLEQLGLLDAPTIVLLQTSSVGGERESVDEVTSNPIWQQLPAVQSGRVVEFDRLGYPGVQGQIRFLDEFADVVGGTQ